MSSDMIISSSPTGKRHALIQKIREDFFITDLNSTNGTFVNKRPVPQGNYMKPEPGDRIKIGKTVLTIR